MAKSLRRRGIVLVMQGIVFGAMMAHAQQNPISAAGDAIDKKDYASAEKLLSEYLEKHPKDSTAMLLLGTARLDAKDIDGAIAELKVLVQTEPMDWYGHIYLAQAYAQKADWVDFYKERAIMKAARDSHAHGIQLVEDGDVIDTLTVGGQQYTVKSYYQPVGPHHTRYVFLHIVDGVKLVDFFTCDSDDGDQVTFKSDHPKEAAAGARRYSLDPWDVVNNQPVHTHVILFYDGEPSYEVLRGDVIKVLEAKYQTPVRASGSDKK